MGANTTFRPASEGYDTCPVNIKDGGTVDWYRNMSSNSVFTNLTLPLGFRSKWSFEIRASQSSISSSCTKHWVSIYNLTVF